MVARVALISIGVAGIFTTGLLCAAILTIGLIVVASVYRWGERSARAFKIHNQKTLLPTDLHVLFEASVADKQSHKIRRFQLPEKVFFAILISSFSILYFTNIQNSMWGVWALFMGALSLASLAYMRYAPKDQEPLYTDDL